MNTLAPFINRRVVVLHKYDTIFRASRAMSDNNIGCVIIADQHGYVVGMITDRDIACHMSSVNLSQGPTLDIVMETGLIWATERETLQDVIGLMISNAIRRVPIVRHTSRGHVKCVGFVSLDDLICHGAITIDEAAEIVISQMATRIKTSAIYNDTTNIRDDQREDDFYKYLCDTTDLDEKQARRATISFLEVLVRRSHPEQARALVSILPQRWGNHLLHFLVGPDENIGTSRLVNNISTAVGAPEREARQLSRAIYKSLVKLTHNSNVLKRFMSQLPLEFQILLRQAPIVPYKKINNNNTSTTRELF